MNFKLSLNFLVLGFFLFPPLTPAYTIKVYYENLPDFKKNSPFIGLKDDSLQEQLHSGLIKTNVVRPYTSYQPDKKFYFNVKSNVENIENLKKVFKKITPAFDLKKTSFWKIKLESDEEPELLVIYDTIEKESGDQYSHIWLLKRIAGKYKDFYIGPFLYGELLDVLKFGDAPEKSIFIKFATCGECEANFLLAISHFDSFKNDIEPFLFKNDNNGYDATIEFSEPNGADSDSKIPCDHKAGTPCLIQHFKMLNCDQGDNFPDDWWVFKCVGYKCNIEKFHDLPSQYKNFWEKFQSLGFQKGKCL